MLLFDRHESHYNTNSFDLVVYKFIHEFMLNTLDKDSNQQNDNGTDDYLKTVYNKNKCDWIEKLKLKNSHHYI